MCTTSTMNGRLSETHNITPEYSDIPVKAVNDPAPTRPAEGFEAFEKTRRGRFYLERHFGPWSGINQRF